MISLRCLSYAIICLFLCNKLFCQWTQDADGWTILNQSSDSRVIYVSSSDGNDTNDGLSETSPKATIAAAYTLLRDEYPDWLLLKRGDTFNETFGLWNKSGRSRNEPMVINTYGDASTRPIINIGSNGYGLGTLDPGTTDPTTNPVEFFAMVGVEFYGNADVSGNGGTGLQLLKSCIDWLIEDCKVTNCYLGVVIQAYQGRHTNMTLRRNVVAHNFTTEGGHSQGAYCYGVDGLTMDECVFYHNGWSETVNGANPNIFRRNLYIDNGNTGFVFRNNIVTGGASGGMQARCGGIVENNIFAWNPVSLMYGGGNSPEVGGVEGRVTNNIILECRDIDAMTPRGFGIWIANIKDVLVSDNILMNNLDAGGPRGIFIDGGIRGLDGLPSPIQRADVTNNIIYNFRSGIVYPAGPEDIIDVNISNNVIQESDPNITLIEHYIDNSYQNVTASNNKYYHSTRDFSRLVRVNAQFMSISDYNALIEDTSSTVEQVSYSDPDRTIGSYHASLGRTATIHAFMEEAILQSKHNWRQEYTYEQTACYFRSGFDLVADCSTSDIVSPTITCISDQNLDCSTNIIPDYTALVIVIDNVDPNPEVTQYPAVGSPFVDGMTITITATDASDNSSSCFFVIEGQGPDCTDTEAPVIACPSDQELDCSTTTIPDYTAMVTTTDDTDPNPVITQDPVSGSSFVDGMTITMTATDASDNSSNCSFVVNQHDESIEAGEDE
uniref:right-handed parallel beta-helix repeat-containing protein n=1 Tax=Aquimarina megaterium TaxID=1443666 RepID=UPI00126810DB